MRMVPDGVSRADHVGRTVAEMPPERKPAALVRAHANWRPGNATLRPFLERVCQLPVTDQTTE